MTTSLASKWALEGQQTAGPGPKGDHPREDMSPEGPATGTSHECFRTNVKQRKELKDGLSSFLGKQAIKRNIVRKH